MRRIASCVSLRRGQDEALGLRLPVVSGAAPVRKIITKIRGSMNAQKYQRRNIVSPCGINCYLHHKA
jgi:hypothetical protein